MTSPTAPQRMAVLLRRSAWVRWALLLVVVVVGWFLFFWAVNALSSNGTTPAPASTSMPSGEV